MNRLMTSWPSMQVFRADINQIEKLDRGDLCFVMMRTSF